MNELKSYTEYAVSTPTADFVIGFDFNYGEDAVNVTVDDIPATEAGYTVVYLNETTIRLSPSVPSGVVRLQRETDIDQTDHAYRAGAKFIAQTMDENFEQLRHAQQEVRDGFSKLTVDQEQKFEDFKDSISHTELRNTVQEVHNLKDQTEGYAETVETNYENSQALMADIETFAADAEQAKVLAVSSATEAQHYIDEARTYVDTTVITQNAAVSTALTAQTNTVNTALSNLSTVASKFYPTLVAANTDIANIAVNQVVNIGEVANGGLWYKATAGATSLTKSPYDPVEVAKEDATLKANNVKLAAQNTDVNFLLALQQIAQIISEAHADLDVTDAMLLAEDQSINTRLTHLLLAIQQLTLTISDNQDDFDVSVKIINENTENTSKLNTSIQSVIDAISTLTEQVGDITLNESDKLEALFIEQCKAAELSKLDGFDPASSGSNTYVSSENIAIFPTPDGLIRIDVTAQGTLPTAKGIVLNTENKINVSGQVLSCFGTLEVQGASSAYYPKKNWTLAFFSDADRKKPISVKLGYMKEHEDLVFKSNFVDNTHTRNIAVNRVWDQMQLARAGFPKRECDFINMTSGNGVASMPTGATGHVDGFPAVMYINGEFYGLGCLNIGKKRGNYNLKKTNPKHIQLDPEGDVNIYSLPATPLDNPVAGIEREAFDVRNPSNWTSECQGYYDRLRTFLSQTKAQMEAAGIDNYINRASMMDYIILIQIFDLYDHIHKNTLYTTWNGNVWHFLPYDVDTVMGLHTNGRYVDESNNEYHPASTLRIPSGVGDHNWGTMAKFRQIYGSAIDNRYAELRRKNIISVDNIVNICESLVRKFPIPLIESENKRWDLVTGGEIWNTIQQTGSINQIHNWLSIRLPLCDTYFNFTA